MTAVQRHHARNRHAALNERANDGCRALAEAALELVETGKAELGRGLAKVSIANTYVVTRPASALSLLSDGEHVAVRATCALRVPARVSKCARRISRECRRETRPTLSDRDSVWHRARPMSASRPGVCGRNGGVS